uniref:Nephrocystin 3-like N-terminal domain-containing protein n=1 Tax=Bionectria ochroleuca TaxID=29856 RepID=A0A8H7NI03_BIOOC
MASPPDPSTNANHARKLRHGGTGAWLLEHPVFQDWYSGSRQHLWLHGLAGCGKTVLSATVLDYLAKGSGRLILSFFFDFGDEAKKTVDGMLRSLVFQLYRGGLILRVSSTPHSKHIKMAATSLQQKRSQMLYESTSRDELLRWIKDTVSRQGLSHVQIVCTSRPESKFQCDMPSLMGAENSLALDKQSVNADIRSYVAAQLSERRDFRDKRLSPEIRDKGRRRGRRHV